MLLLYQTLTLQKINQKFHFGCLVSYIKSAAKNCAVILHNYCLMGNHYKIIKKLEMQVFRP